MPGLYGDKSHEELRSEDYELQKRLTFSIENQGNAIQRTNSSFGPCTMPKFGISSGHNSTSWFNLFSTSSSGNSSMLGVQTSSGSQGITTIASTVSKQRHGSAVSSYLATDIDRASNMYSFGKIQSISEMPVYKDRSHEELRLEDYQLSNKGGRTLIGDQFLSSTLSKSSDTPVNIFPSPPLFNQSTLNSPFQSFKPKIVSLNTGNFNNPNNTTQSVSTSKNPFSFTSSSPNNTISTAPTVSQCTSPFSFISLNPNSTISTTPVVSQSMIPFSFTSLYPSSTVSSASTVSQSTSSFSFTSSSPNSIISTSPTVSQCPCSFTSLSHNGSIYTAPTVSKSMSLLSFTSSFTNNTSSTAPTLSPFTSPFSFTSLSPNNTLSTAPTVSQSTSPFSFTSLSPNITLPASSTVSQSNSPFSFTSLSPNNTLSTPPTVSQSMSPFSFTCSSPNNTISKAPTVSQSKSPLSFTSSSPNNVTSRAPTFSSSTNGFSPAKVYHSQSQVSIPQNTQSLNPPSVTPFGDSMLANRNQFLKISTFTSPSVGPFSSTKPSGTQFPIECTPVKIIDSWPFTPKAAQLGKYAEKVVSVLPSQVSNCLMTAEEFNNQNMTGQKYVPSRTLGVQSSHVANPFVMESPINQSNALPSRQYGLSSLPVSNNLSSNRRASFLRKRNVYSRRPPLPARRPICGGHEAKALFFIDEPGRVAPFLPRENPRAWIKNSLSLHSHSDGKDHEHNKNSTARTIDTPIQVENLSLTSNQHKEYVDTVTEEVEADILVTMPKLHEGEYYTEPSIKELAAKEKAEPGWCGHVKDFVVGRKGYGSIKYLGETDVRHLQLESIIQFNDREVIVYPDAIEKPAVGEGLNKAAEITLLNVKCISKKTGKQYVEGSRVHSYKEMLRKKTLEQGVEFVSYDPVRGEWKFRVQHF